MNRPIKFRAWDEEQKEMTYWPFGFAEMFGYFSNQGQVDRLHRLEWMQFTGLPDKNGKEIYEGDIFSIVEDVVVETIGGYPRSEPEGRVETVGFKDGAFWIGEEHIWGEAKYGEVIGNIYENSDLLV